MDDWDRAKCPPFLRGPLLPPTARAHPRATPMRAHWGMGFLCIRTRWGVGRLQNRKRWDVGGTRNRARWGMVGLRNDAHMGVGASLPPKMLRLGPSMLPRHPAFTTDRPVQDADPSPRSAGGRATMEPLFSSSSCMGTKTSMAVLDTAKLLHSMAKTSSLRVAPSYCTPMPPPTVSRLLPWSPIMSREGLQQACETRCNRATKWPRGWQHPTTAGASRCFCSLSALRIRAIENAGWQPPWPSPQSATAPGMPEMLGEWRDGLGLFTQLCVDHRPLQAYHGTSYTRVCGNFHAKLLRITSGVERLCGMHHATH